MMDAFFSKRLQADDRRSRKRRRSMIRRIAKCPYCERGAVDLDSHTGAVLFDAERSDVGTCPHAVALNVCLDAQREIGPRFKPDENLEPPFNIERMTPPSADWLWLRGRVPIQNCIGNRRHRNLLHYLEDLFLDALYGTDPFPMSLRPPQPHQVVGGSAGEREEKESGSGEFALRLGDGLEVHAALDGWVLYSTDAGPVAAALLSLSRRHARCHGRRP
jgi:hypothetical protein